MALGLDKLKFLEQLTFDSAEIDSKFVAFLPQLKRLRMLKLKYCLGLENLNRIDDLNQLTTLKITDSSTESELHLDVARLVKRLSKLHFLSLDMYGFSLGKEKYFRIVDAMRRRRDESKLLLRYRSRFDYSDWLPHFARRANLVEMIVERC